MTLLLRDQENIEKGIEKGLLKGKFRGMDSLLKKSPGMSVEEAAYLLSLSEEELKAYRKQKKAPL